MSSDGFPTVWIESNAFAKLNTYYKYAEKEISGLGIVVADQGELVVQDVLLFEQTASFSETELDMETLAKWDLELRRSGGDPSLYRLWWHKHPIQGWSTVDEQNIQKMNNGEWLLSIVHTPNGLLARLDLYAPFRVTMDQLAIRENRAIDWEMDKQLKEEVATKVKTKFYSAQLFQGYSGGKYEAGGRTWVNDGQGSWKLLIDKSEKKDASPSDTNTSTDAHDAYFESLAERDWESHYSWNDRNRLPDEEHIRQRLYGRDRF